MKKWDWAKEEKVTNKVYYRFPKLGRYMSRRMTQGISLEGPSRHQAKFYSLTEINSGHQCISFYKYKVKFFSIMIWT